MATPLPPCFRDEPYNPRRGGERVPGGHDPRTACLLHCRQRGPARLGLECRRHTARQHGTPAPCHTPPTRLASRYNSATVFARASPVFSSFSLPVFSFCGARVLFDPICCGANEVYKSASSIRFLALRKKYEEARPSCPPSPCVGREVKEGKKIKNDATLLPCHKALAVPDEGSWKTRG